MPGVQSTDFPLASVLEEVLGNTGGTTSRQTISDLAVQLAARPELATLTAALSARVDTLEGVAGDSRIVDDIAAGLAATESGSHFLILSAGALTIYENVDGSESVIDVIPLASVTDALAAADAALSDRVAALEAVPTDLTFQGGWDASSGSFPGLGTASEGDYWDVSTAATVDSVAFAVGDQIIALTDNASTNTYVAHWHRKAGGSSRKQTWTLRPMLKTPR